MIWIIVIDDSGLRSIDSFGFNPSVYPSIDCSIDQSINGDIGLCLIVCGCHPFTPSIVISIDGLYGTELLDT